MYFLRQFIQTFGCFIPIECPPSSQPPPKPCTDVILVSKSGRPVRRDGPKWDPGRLTEETLFILGSRANKALGYGQTRGRLYIKHPELFK